MEPNEKDPAIQAVLERAKAKPNKSDLARRAGCAREHIYNVIDGKSVPLTPLFLNLARGLGMRSIPLYPDEPDPNAPLTKEDVDRVREAAATYDKKIQMLARQADVDETELRQFIQKKAPPRIGTLRSVAKVLRIPLPNLKNSFDDDPVDIYFRNLKRRMGSAHAPVFADSEPLEAIIKHRGDLSSDQRAAILKIIKQDYAGATVSLMNLVQNQLKA